MKFLSGDSGRAGARRPASHEQQVFRLALAGGIPALLTAGILLWKGADDLKTAAAVTFLLALTLVGFALSARGRVVHTLQTLANLVEALREGDYSVRGRARGDDALAEVMREINQLGRNLQNSRVGALESAALLRAVMERIDTAIFTFDSQTHLRLVNRAGERLLGRPAETLLGKSADRIGLAAWLEGPAVRTVEGQLFHNPGRFSVRRSSFREDGRPHHLIVVTDLRQALREEERQAWQRIIRVLGHELNNSLAPIQSIADSLLSSARRPGKRDDWESDLERGLQVIGSRSAALGRFLDGYRQLARLPAPQPKPVNLAEMLPRVAALETRVPIHLERGEKTILQADADQLEQVLINLLRNAADAILAAGDDGGVTLSWRRDALQVEILVSDEGPGLASTANLFVPFFTTKPAGSGIGLLLSRQIAEAHGGALTLSNRTDRSGCVARLSLPLEAPPN